ncbi:hypothetical protein AN958_11894 [Leucoagaricus sp. SymC.cos]|nr:hypothetical protein AN958_11894 [Leucoagaricus sp. SymC.cos]
MWFKGVCADVFHTQAEELQYAYHVIGFECFLETLFENAGRNLFNGSLDLRVCISYYPDLRGGLFGDESGVDVFAGAVERMPSTRNVEELIRESSYSILRDHGYVIDESDCADEGAGEMMIDEKTAYLQAEQIVDEKFGGGDDVPVVSEKVHEAGVVVGPEDERREEVREGEDGEDGGVIGEERNVLGLIFDGDEEEEGAEGGPETRADGGEDEDEDEDEEGKS